MRSKVRLGVFAVSVVAAAVVVVSPGAASQKKLHDGTVISCSIRHDAGIAQDILNLRIAEAQADKKVISKLGDNNGPAEIAVALLFLSNSTSPRAVVDGSDKAKFNKKGKADLEMSFNSFGTYQVNLTVSHKGFKPARDSFQFRVSDTNGGACTVTSP